jgi:adenylate kinase family enzyme
MKIHIVGASGSGVTTLGRLLAAEINCQYIDSDDYFWEKSAILYTVKRNAKERNKKLQDDLAIHHDWILGGSMTPWGDHLIPSFDLVIFLWVPQELRILRLKHREFERYGKIIFPDPERRRRYKEFMKWAEGYDDNTAQGRTMWAHEKWLSKIPCSILELRGDLSNEYRLEVALRRINKTGIYPALELSQHGQ